MAVVTERPLVPTSVATGEPEVRPTPVIGVVAALPAIALAIGSLLVGSEPSSAEVVRAILVLLWAAAGTALTVRRAQTEAFPRMQSAEGFVGFYLVTDEKEGINTAIIVFESQEHCDKYIAASKDWWKALDDLGHTLQTANSGPTNIELGPTK